MLNTDPTQCEGICSFADIKKAIEIYAQFYIVCWDYLHTYSLYVPVTGQALYADICKFRLGEQRDQ